LTVEDHEFFAAGLLVHNSLAIAAWLGERRGQDWAPPSDAPAQTLLSKIPDGMFYEPEGGGNPWDARW
jgi:hypothetical protein